MLYTSYNKCVSFVLFDMMDGLLHFNLSTKDLFLLQKVSEIIPFKQRLIVFSETHHELTLRSKMIICPTPKARSGGFINIQWRCSVTSPAGCQFLCFLCYIQTNTFSLMCSDLHFSCHRMSGGPAIVSPPVGHCQSTKERHSTCQAAVSFCLTWICKSLSFSHRALKD